ncbi:hypothetical protein GCM10025768_25860 [Microbacterium pseudoresistens]|uniref:Alpha-amylase n=1 Tax=Microbacterium pseudoresistens TaxID=640634 RepID=A0A7Y9EWM8_9MICO|nr:carboxypeptidase-like regulatory domain-containing protein [Microbacterium pseudoresistens]NYD55204.1 hypothetical protein [Microbacterium pseudoresistens]
MRSKFAAAFVAALLMIALPGAANAAVPSTSVAAEGLTATPEPRVDPNATAHPEATPAPVPSTAPTETPAPVPTADPEPSPSPEPTVAPEPDRSDPSSPAPRSIQAPRAKVTPSDEAAGASVSGTVTKDGGQPITGADALRVTLATPEGETIDALSSSDGSYSFTGITAAAVVVGFESSTGQLVREYFDGADRITSATVLDFTDDPTGSRTADADLDSAGFISGTVTCGSGDCPSNSVTVHARPLANGGWSGSANVSADGSYTITGLAAGDHAVEFASTSSYMGEFYDNVWNSAEASIVSVTAGATVSGVDAQLAPGSTLRGHVTRADGGSFATSTVVVYASPIDGEGLDVNIPVASDGSYELTGVAPGDYRVYSLADDNSTNLLGGYYGGSDWDTATTVTIPSDAPIERNDLDLTMALGSELHGTVVRGDGEPWGASTPAVSLFELGTSGSGGTPVEADGSYVIHAIPPGDYTLKFHGVSDGGVMWGDQWYNGQITPDNAETISFTEATTLTGYDATLTPAYPISGTVTLDNGAAIRDHAIFTTLETRSGSTVSFGEVRVDGTFEFTNVPEGEYTVRFSGNDWVRGAYYGGAEWVEDATFFVVDGAAVTGIDQVLAAGVPLSGTLTRSDGGPITDNSVYVWAYDSDYQTVAGDWVGIGGTYTIPALPVGEYRLNFSPQSSSPFLSEWYDDARDFYTATPVSVSDTDTPITGIDAELLVGGEIQGTVRGPDGEPLADVSVNAWSASAAIGSYASTDENGEYTIVGVAPGENQVNFYAPWGSGLLSEYYDNARDPDDATMVVVDSSTPATGIDAQLEQGSSISGQVTLPEGDYADCRIQIALVDAYPDPNQQSGDSGGHCVPEDGTFSINGIAPGDYKLRLFDSTGDPALATVWYDAANSRDGAQVITFVEGEPTDLDGIDFTMVPGGSVEGTVSRSDGGQVRQLTVDALDAETGDVVATGWIPQVDGSFTITRLPFGDYVFRTSAPGLPDAWHGGDSRESATVVTISSTTTLTGIDLAFGQAVATELSVLSGGGEQVSTGQTLKRPIVLATDGDGNAAYGQTVEFVVSGPAAFADGTTEATATTNSAGQAAAPVLIAGGEAGEVVVTAQVRGVPDLLVTLPASTVVEVAADALTADITTEITVTSGRATLLVDVTNTSDTPVSVRITTPYGTRYIADVAVGASIQRSFAWVLPTIADGTLTVRLTDTAQNISVDIPVDYEGNEA